jgi:hypothetical protein
LLRLCLRKTWHARNHHGGEQSEQAGPALSGHIHGLTPLYRLPEAGPAAIRPDADDADDEP